MEYQTSHGKDALKKSEALQWADMYLNKLEETWRAAGLPCLGFREKETRDELRNGLVEEIGKEYHLID